MIKVILFWFAIAPILDYVLSVKKEDVKNPLKKALLITITWPNLVVNALNGLYGRNSWRFPKMAALTNWFKS